MQIIYAAPFFFVAAMAFFLCAAVPRFRRHALVVPVGALSFGVGSVFAYFIFVLIVEALGYHGPANWLYLVPYVGGGLLVAFLSSILYRMIVAILPNWLISVGSVVASFASSLVFLPICSWTIAHFVTHDRLSVTQLAVLAGFWLLIAAAISWKILRISDELRPAPCLTGLIAKILPGS